MPKGLTERQRKFVDAYAQVRRGREAAISAGYGERWAASTASRLLKQPEIAAAVARRIAPKAPKPHVWQTPLEYLRSVMNDPEAAIARRVQAALFLAPYEHEKAGALGKKEKKQQEARAAVKGRFGPGAPPRNVVPFRGKEPTE